MPAKDRLERLKQMREARRSEAGSRYANSSLSPSDAHNISTSADNANNNTTRFPPAVGRPQSSLGNINSNTNLTSMNGSNNTTMTNNNTLRAGIKSFQRQLSAPRFKKDPTPLIPAPSEDKQQDLWAVMAQQAQCDYETKLLREKKEHAAKMAEQKRFLDQQVALREERKAREREAHLAQRPVVDKEHDDWVAENVHKKVVNSIKVAEIGADRASQIERRNAKKQQEVEMYKAADRTILANIEAMNEHARQVQEEQRRRKLQMKEDLIAANEALKTKLAAIKEEEKAFEAKVVEGMRLKEIADYEKRVHEAELFQEKVKGREAMALKIQATMEQRSAEDEERANRVAAEKARKEEERLRAAAEKKERDKEAVLRIRSLQVEAKALAKAEAEANKKKEKAVLTEQYRKEMEKVRMEAEAERLKHEAQRKLLDTQMEERSHFHTVIVSSEEKKINTDILSRAERDKHRHTPLPYTPLNRDSGYKNRESASRIF